MNTGDSMYIVTAGRVKVAMPDPFGREKVLAFLQKQQAAFENFILDEKPEVWQKKFEIEGPPCIFVFNREGKYQKFNTGEKYDAVEKVVAQLLKQ